MDDNRIIGTARNVGGKVQEAVGNPNVGSR
jgi:uncharacterized protein YjbJ (UPF0337 family)